MSEMTKTDKSKQTPELTPKQEKAILLMLSGKSDREIAETVGVARPTVNLWRNKNPRFIAALNYERRILWDYGRDKVLHLTRKALDVVDKALEAGDSHAALSFLKMCNCTDVTFDGQEFEDDPRLVFFEMLKCDVATENLVAGIERVGASETPPLMCHMDPEVKRLYEAMKRFLQCKCELERNGDAEEGFQAPSDALRDEGAN